ncbi:hypothetical protein BH23PAT2_BH23PAT2_09160 [soil metagenome]
MAIMNNEATQKTTVYLSPTVRRALKMRTIDSNQTMSAYVESAVAAAVAEDLADIETIEKRRNEPTESLDTFLDAMKRDGVLRS